MAVKYVIDDTTMTKIADPLRELTGETGELTPNEMADAGESAVAEVDTQTALMEQIQAALESKAGSGGINPSGTLNITENGSYDVANYASAEVNVPPEGCNHTTVTQATPSITVSSFGLITAKSTQSAGLVSAGTKSATKQLSVQGSKTVIPAAYEQIAVPAGVYVTEDVKVAAVESASMTGDELLCSIIDRSITNLQLPNGLKKIGYGAFQYCEALKTAVLPDGITEIGELAFETCTSLETIALPDSVVIIDDHAFLDCFELVLTSLPNNLETIGYNAFNGTGIKNITIPSKVRTIASQAFAYSYIESVTFKGTPQSIANDTFTDNDTLTVINVPWAKGAVANAPWGATNATINYNYAG